MMTTVFGHLTDIESWYGYHVSDFITTPKTLWTLDHAFVQSFVQLQDPYLKFLAGFGKLYSSARLCKLHLLWKNEC